MLYIVGILDAELGQMRRIHVNNGGAILEYFSDPFNVMDLAAVGCMAMMSIARFIFVMQMSPETSQHERGGSGRR